jgi:hypothetical protein
MKRRLVLLNLVLLALASAAAWQLRGRWLQDRAQERELLRQRGRIAALPPASSIRPLPPVSASTYSEVAQKMLFSPDRNPNVVVEVAAPKPVPAFPAAFGVMDIGSGPTVFLSEKPGASSRGYSAGEKVGEFTLLSVAGDEVVFEWDGRKFPKKLQELRRLAAAQPAADSGAPAAPAPVQSVPVAVQSGPGAQVSAEAKACVPGDPSPAGTVRDGYTKVVVRTPFGSSCRWESTK